MPTVGRETLKAIGIISIGIIVLVTPTKFSLNLTVMSLMNPGDEAILPEPYYLSYPDIVRLMSSKSNE